MSELAGISAVLLALHEAARPFRRLRDAIPVSLAPTPPALHAFEGFDGTGGAGVRLFVHARHPDGRALFWQIEVWIDRHGGEPGAEWYGTVKAEIDLDDDDGDDYCVVNEQQHFASGAEAATLIRTMSEVVCGYSLDELLARRWAPEDFDDPDEDGAPIGAVWTRTVVTVDKAGGVIETRQHQTEAANDEAPTGEVP